MATKKYPINTKWFTERLAAHETSLRQLAGKIKMDPSALSLTFRGRRKMTLGEANQIANLLGVQVTEVLRQAGVPVADAKGIRVTGYVMPDSRVSSATAAKQIAAPPDVPASGFALQVRSPATHLDGASIYVGDKVLGEAAIGRLCVVETETARVIGTVRRGYDDDTMAVSPLLGGEVMDFQQEKKVAPVLWIRPR